MGVTRTELQLLKDARPTYKWRVQEARQYGANCVAYVDARQVMDLLDDIVGPENWQDSYREVSGNVYCDLSIQVGEQWITKSDCGSESNIEAEKGQASDAFKRAAIKWGICRFLYTLDIVKLKTIPDGTDSKGKPRFAPADDRGQKIWSVTKHINQMQRRPAAELATHDQKEEIKARCQEAGWDSEKLQARLREMGTSWKTLTPAQAGRVIRELAEATKRQNVGA